MTRGPCVIQEIFPFKRNDFLINIRNMRIKPDTGFVFIPEVTPPIVEGIYFISFLNIFSLISTDTNCRVCIKVNSRLIIYLLGYKNM